MNMIRNMAVASVLVAATLAQAGTLFDNTPTGGLKDPVYYTPKVAEIGSSFLVPSTDGMDTKNTCWEYNITGVSFGVVSSSAPDAKAEFSLYANDKAYTVGSGEETMTVWGPGYQFETGDTGFSLYNAADPLGGKYMNVHATGLDVTYKDANWAGVTLMLKATTGGDGTLQTVVAQSPNTSTFEFDGHVASDAFGAYNDYWIRKESGDLTLVTVKTSEDVPVEYPLIAKIDGSATVVPEAGTIQLALMGLAALGGFAGLRRFKRD
mgnify:CR=1 FL=1